MPSIKYFWASSIPLLALVLVLWYTTKHALSPQRQNPLRRGVYEKLYTELATSHPALWTRRGPRPDLVPAGGAFAAVKWRLLTRWFGADKLVLHDTDARDSFSAWSRVKRALVRRWLAQIKQDATASPGLPVTAADTTAGPATTDAGDDDLLDLSPPPKHLGAVRELLTIATPVALAEIEPTAASRLQKRVPAARLRSLSPPRSEASARRWSGSPRASAGSAASEGGPGGGSGVMVEEKGSEDDRSGDESGGR